MRFIFLVLTGLCFLTACTSKPAQTLEQEASSARAGFKAEQLAENSDYRGWGYLVSKLKADGIAESDINGIYKSSRMPKFSRVPFKLKPAESMRDYVHFLHADKIRKAKSFLGAYDDTFKRVKTTFGVSPKVVAAILLIETDFGENLGKNLVIERLSRVSSVGENKNLRWNFETIAKSDRRVTFEQVKSRAEYLENIFYPEILALLELCKKNNLDVFEVRGSRAGAFGIPQFLPSSYLKFAVDGNQDGIVSLFREEDAIWSVAHFLSKSGWGVDATLEDQKSAIWKYNRSNPYVETVLKVAAKL